MERTNRTTALNHLNHWIHLTKVRSRNENFVREEGCPHELSCGYSRTCAIFFAPRPRAFTKIAIFVLQNVPKEKILYYRELLVSEKFFKTRWIPLVLPSPVILGETFFYYRGLLVSEKFLYNTGFPLWFYSLCRVFGLFWAKSTISFFFKFIHWFKICLTRIVQ